MRITSFIITILLSIIFAGCVKQQISETKVSDKIDNASKTNSAPSAPNYDLSRLANFEKDGIANWKLASPIHIYDKKSIFDYIDGAAELYFAYDFNSIASAEYQNGETSIMIDIYDMTAPEGAFGIYSLNRAQDANYVNIGNEGILTGAALDFWKGRYFCKIYSFDASEKYQSDVVKFGETLASKIQDAGKEPSVIGKLPQTEMIPRSAKFFSRKLGLDNIHFITEENIFNLDGETKGAVAEYQSNGAKCELFVIEYPSQEKANSAFESYSKYLGGKGESVSAVKVSGEKSKIVKLDGKFTFVKINGQTLTGFWNIETQKAVESVLQYMI